MKNGAAVLGAPKLPAMELIPPRDAEVEGVFRQHGSVHNNRIIYFETTLDVAATKATARIKTDKAGNEVWKRNQATGEPIYPILVKTPVMQTRRFVLWPDNRNRHVKKVYHFEPTAEELQAIAQKEAEQTFFRDFVAESAKAGLTAAEVVARIKASILEPDERADQVELSVTEDVVAEMMAESDGLMDRPEQPDEDEGVSDDKVPDMAIGATPVESPSQRRRRRAAKA